MPGDFDPKQLPTTVAEDQKGKQAVKAYRRDDHYIDGCYRISMIAKKRPPAL
jgi:hypothetical protein